MKNKLFFALFVSLGLQTQAQLTTTVACDAMALSVNISDTNLIDLYHAGHYLTSPGEYNSIDWVITDMEGNLIAQDVLIDESRFNFQPNIPLSDTLNVSAHLTNDSAFYEGNPVNCLIQDQLYWKEDYYPTGTLYGRWTLVHESFGVDQNTVGVEDVVFQNKPLLIKIVDVLGRECERLKNTPLFYLYNDGTIDKKIIIE